MCDISLMLEYHFYSYFFLVPTGLLCFMGSDEQGHFILNNLKKMGVTTDFIEGQGIVLRQTETDW